jgi:hypothetical protein
MGFVFTAVPGAGALVIIVIAFGLILGLIRGPLAAGVLGRLFIGILIVSLAGAVIDMLPWWFLIPAGIFVGLRAIRTAATLLLGRHIAEETIAILLADAIRFGFRLVLTPFRLIPWLIRRAG